MLVPRPRGVALLAAVLLVATMEGPQQQQRTLVSAGHAEEREGDVAAAAAAAAARSLLYDDPFVYGSRPGSPEWFMRKREERRRGDPNRPPQEGLNRDLQRQLRLAVRRRAAAGARA